MRVKFGVGLRLMLGFDMVFPAVGFVWSGIALLDHWSHPVWWAVACWSHLAGLLAMLMAHSVVIPADANGEEEHTARVGPVRVVRVGPIRLKPTVVNVMDFVGMVLTLAGVVAMLVASFS